MSSGERGGGSNGYRMPWRCSQISFNPIGHISFPKGCNSSRLYQLVMRVPLPPVSLAMVSSFTCLMDERWYLTVLIRTSLTTSEFACYLVWKQSKGISCLLLLSWPPGTTVGGIFSTHLCLQGLKVSTPLFSASAAGHSLLSVQPSWKTTCQNDLFSPLT